MEITKANIAIDCLNHMIKLGQHQQLPELANIYESIAALEQRMGKSIKDYLGFGFLSEFSLMTVSDKKIGEFNSYNNLNGRGIKIHASASIDIGHWIDD